MDTSKTLLLKDTWLGTRVLQLAVVASISVDITRWHRCATTMQVCQKEILLQHIKDLNTSSFCVQGQDPKLQAIRTLQDKNPEGPYQQCDSLQTSGEAQIPIQTPGFVFVWFGVWFVVLWWGLGGPRGAEGVVILVWCFGGQHFLFIFLSWVFWLALVSLSLIGNKSVLFNCKTCPFKNYTIEGLPVLKI